MGLISTLGVITLTFCDKLTVSVSDALSNLITDYPYDKGSTLVCCSSGCNGAIAMGIFAPESALQALQGYLCLGLGDSVPMEQEFFERWSFHAATTAAIMLQTHRTIEPRDQRPV